MRNIIEWYGDDSDRIFVFECICKLEIVRVEIHTVKLFSWVFEIISCGNILFNLFWPWHLLGSTIGNNVEYLDLATMFYNNLDGNTLLPNIETKF